MHRKCRLPLKACLLVTQERKCQCPQVTPGMKCRRQPVILQCHRMLTLTLHRL
jgi:hypothetical protein